jgi:hypothetical protein
MRGRRPQKLTIVSRDWEALHAAAHYGSLPWFQVQRATESLVFGTTDQSSLSPSSRRSPLNCQQNCLPRNGRQLRGPRLSRL